MHFFVSSTTVLRPPASELIAALRAAGHQVDHSPRGPDDPRWPDWYQSGSQLAIAACETFIIVLDRAWDSSTWMAHEADLGTARVAGRLARWCTVFDPDGLRLAARAVPHYEGLELPADLNQAVAMLTCSSCAAFGRDLGTGDPHVRFSLGGWGYELAIDSHPALEQQYHQQGSHESGLWLLRCRDCDTWWHVCYTPLYDLRLFKPTDVSSVAEWRDRLARFCPRVYIPLGHNFTILLGVLGFLAAIVLQMLLKSL